MTTKLLLMMSWGLCCHLHPFLMQDVGLASPVTCSATSHGGAHRLGVQSTRWLDIPEGKARGNP